VHRVLMEYALARGPGTRLNPLYKLITELLVLQGIGTRGEPAKPMRPADAFVLTYAFAGVMRGLVATADRPLPRRDVEDALTRLMVSFVQSLQSRSQAPSV
jgi:hypothetical protein